MARKPTKAPDDSRAKLTARHRIAVEHLASGKTVTATAIAMGVDRGTVSDWRKIPEFRAALDAALDDIAGEARDRTKATVNECVDLWAEVLRNPDAEHRDRIRAAEALADRGGLTVTKGVDLTAKDAIVVSVNDAALLRGLSMPGDA